jgi:transcriptional regulator with XRE-family HTH domain
MEVCWLSTFGQIIAKARKALDISQKDLAAQIRKEDGDAISPQYLNDMEHDRRDPPSEFFNAQFAKHLKLSKEHLIAAAGMWPTDLREKLPAADPKKVEEAFTAFRKVLKEKP